MTTEQWYPEQIGVWDQAEKFGGSNKNSKFVPMETGYELLLPKRIYQYIDEFIGLLNCKINRRPREKLSSQTPSKIFFASLICCLNLLFP